MAVQEIELNSQQADHDVVKVLCSVLKGEAVDWPPIENDSFYDSLLDSAVYHGVSAMVCFHLKPTRAWENFPVRVKESLLQALRVSAVQELIRKRDLLLLHAAFQQAGVPALIIKGTALAYTLYPQPFLRARADTDIFIDIHDIDKIRGIFRGLGYDFRGWTYKSHQFNCLKYDLDGGTVNYDVHWRSSNNSRFARVINFQRAWHTSIPISELAGWHVLNPQHALLQSCIHLLAMPADDSNRLRWYYDIHLLITSMTELELLEFARSVVTENVQSICHEAIMKSVKSFSTHVPEEVLQVLSDPRNEGSKQHRFSTSQLALIFDDLRQLRGLSQKLALVCEYLFPPGDYLLHRYGKSGRLWIPVLYLRYVLGGFFERITLR